MKIIDISWPISDATTEYKQKKTITFNALKQFAKDGVRESAMCMGTHTGTHVDAPSHFLRDGIAIDQIPLEHLFGLATVFDFLTVAESVTADDLAHYDILPDTIVLLRTANSARGENEQFNTKFISLHSSGAEYLVEKKIKAVGIDYLGIEHGDPEHTTHTTLMRANIPIIEGLRLGHVTAGHYFFICLPLALIGLEAAPARAVLMKD